MESTSRRRHFFKSTMGELQQVFREASRIAMDRERRYGKSWETDCTIETHWAMVQEKKRRIDAMEPGDERYEEALDLVNYAMFIASKVRRDRPT